MSEFWTLNRSLITKLVDIHSMCTQESVHEPCIHLYMKCLQKTPVRTSLLVQISIYCKLKFASITHKLVTKLLSSFDFAWFFQIKWRHKCVDTVQYASDTCSVPCLTAALHGLCWRVTFSWHLIYSVVHYIYIYIYIYIVHVFTAVNY